MDKRVRIVVVLSWFSAAVVQLLFVNHSYPVSGRKNPFGRVFGNDSKIFFIFRS